MAGVAYVGALVTALSDDADPIRAVEIAAARAWPATVTAGHAGWLLRATPGVGRARSNSALPPPSGGGGIGDLDAVIAWQHAHAGRARIMVSPLERHPQIDAELERRGWTEQWAVDVLVAPLAPIARAAGRLDLGVSLRSAPDQAWCTAWAACEQRTPASIRPEAEHVLAALGSRAVYALAGPELDPAGVGVAVPVGRWCALLAMATHPAARGRGVASGVLATLADAALRRGATGAYLQVTTTNTAAQALYARHGFRRSHAYRTREAPLSSSFGPGVSVV